MKKVLATLLFVVIVALLPGGALLAMRKLAQRMKLGFLVGCLAIVTMSAGCAGFHYQTSDKNWIEGVTASPETVMVADAEAHAIRRCTEDQRHCGALWGAWGAGSMDTPAGYTWAGIRATGGNGPENGGDVRRDITDIKKSVRAISKWQDTFTKTYKNRKNRKGNRK